MKKEFTFSVILLSGGKGLRMGSTTPKQYLSLGQKRVIDYSLAVLERLDSEELCIVCEKKDESFFAHVKEAVFARPGSTRQGSMHKGLLALTKPCDLILIHDGARPFLNLAIVHKVLLAAWKHQASACGLKAHATFKLVDEFDHVKQTIPREFLREIQTPQALRRDLLEKGFKTAKSKQLELTDDIALAELLGIRPYIVEGNSCLFKITTPQDLAFAEFLLNTHDEKKI